MNVQVILSEGVNNLGRPGDVVKVDYLTREIFTVNLEARLYDPASSRPQITALTDKVRVRNLPR